MSCLVSYLFLDKEVINFQLGLKIYLISHFIKNIFLFTNFNYVCIFCVFFSFLSFKNFRPFGGMGLWVIQGLNPRTE